MTIILFLMDTSASMAQKNYKGSSCLDLCKAFVSEFIKARGRDVSNRGFDRYMLLSTEDYPGCVKELRTAWRENALMEPMKSLKPSGRHSLCGSIQSVFRLLNLNRSTTGIDNYGYGRFPYYMEPVFIFSLTDGAAVDEMIPDFKLDTKSKQDLTKEVFRWDQKLFSVVFRVPASHPRFSPQGRIDPDSENIDRCCASTGGRSFSIVCHKQISQCIDQIIQTIQQPGISVRFQCPVLNSAQYRTNNDSSSSNDVLPEVRLKKKLEARPLTTVIVRMVGGKPVTNHWPIPEGFWHTRLENGSIPIRTAQPIIYFMLDSTPSQILSDFPFDKYEIEPSPVVDYILEKFKDGKTDQCLQVFVHNSGRTEGYGKPFGYLKVTSSGTGVNLFLMPYNYPVLIQLLQELKNDQSLRGAVQWRKRLDSYLENVPPYYLLALRKNLMKWKIAGGLLDEQNSLSQVYPIGIINMLNKLKPHAKDEHDRLCVTIAGQIYASSQQTFHVERRIKQTSRRYWKTIATKKDRKDRDRKEQEEFFKDPAENIQAHTPEKTNIQFHMNESKTKAPAVSTYRNPLILNKNDLVDHLPRMCANIRLLLRDSPIPVLEGGRPGFNIKLHHADELHSQPIALMGNYEEYIKSLTAIGRAPLREIEEKPVRTHAFGNPFKTKSLAIDEVGEGPAVGQRSESKEMKRDRKSGSSSAGRPPKRKPGALAQNSLGQWRDRRKTLSEVSSIMSDSSYMKGIDEDVKMVESSSNEKIKENLNGVTSLSNGEVERTGQANLKAWGLEEEDDEGMDVDDGPPSKKSRFGTDLPQKDMRNKKLAISSVIRRPSKDQSVFDEIQKTIYGGSLADAIELYEFSIRDSQRFKRKRLTEKLNIEIRNLRNSINGVT